MGNLILLAVIGGFFYWIFKSYLRYTAYSREAFKNFSVSKESLQKSDLGLFVALVAKVAKADGRVDALEAQLIGIMFDDISAVFPQPQKTKDILKEIFNEEKDRFDNLQSIAQTLGSAIKRDRAKQQQFMGFLIQLAFIDGDVSKNEEQVLVTIAEAFEFDPNAYHAIFDQFEKMMKNVQPKANIEDAYKLLGVNESDDMSVIKKAYRKLIREYHPDIIKSQGKDETYMQEATAKTQEINQAYEMIKAKRK
ncbi:TerB family tellurite resistance protein [Sulfurimonas sp.]|uniref:TerB family tellurite resistance protein n=1 Tax=Sulfurimonas sp. TaxID=2022749 RepID=UPI00260E31EF|nr:TerB family tellurite resistance protein [Sulfurimonas sp.]MCW8894679.1 TerB family tellurite resistance protein [Sulfurimonas sp.]